MKTKYKGGRILALLLLLIAVLLCMSTPASAVTYVDGSSNSYTPGSGSKLTGNNYNVHFTSGAIVGYRFALISKNTSGSYYQVKATDVFYSGSNTYPVSPYTNHLKITAGGTVYRNLSKFAYNNLYSSITKVEAEAYSNSSYSKYTGTASSLGTTITDSAESMKTWCKTASKMNLVLAKFGSYTMANLKDSDRIFVEPLYGLRINGTGYCITVTEMALLGRLFYGDSSTGNEGSAKGYDWLTICEYTNRYYASEMYTSDASHCGIAVGSALSSRATFYNIFTKGYGLYVVRCENPHTLTVYYRTGTGASSLTIGTGYKLASNFSSYSSSYIRNSSDNYYTQSVKYDNTLTLSSGFGMQRDYYTFSHWKDIDSTNTFASGAAKTASQLKSAVSTGDATLTLDAIWKPVNYTITYNLNGGKIGTSTTNPTQSYTYETNVYIGNFTSGATAYTVPTKTGYVFAGWKNIGTDIGYWESGTVYENKYNKGQYEHGNITLTAQWTPISYTVKYYLDGTEQTSLAQTCKYGTSYTYKTLPTKTGYAVSGWNSNSAMTGTAYTAGAAFNNLTTTNGGTVSRYAKSTANSYTVKYYLDGVEQTSLAQTCSYGTNYLYKSLPDKTGYTVTGWNSKSDLTGTAHTAGGSFNNLTTINGGTVSRYAKSTVNVYTITYKWADTGVNITGLTQWHLASPFCKK